LPVWGKKNEERSAERLRTPPCVDFQILREKRPF
jgi:hypothetical protein